jgi:predicted CXXCH cytochrome family protein
VCAFGVVLLLSGCDPVTRYKVTSTIFDGVPSYPPPEQFCQEYAEKKVETEKAAAQQQAMKKGPTGSSHVPYQEKQCDDCHDKAKEGGLVLPKKELCFACHANFVKGTYVHGPVATADCLACHEPHLSTFPKLLKASSVKICETCHREKRITVGLHDRVAAQQLLCVDCHDPHYGNMQFFLK